MSHPKNETAELLQYLKPHELAELEMLATPPKDACGCMVMVNNNADLDAEREAGIQDYVAKNGYMPAIVMCVMFDDAPPGGWPGLVHTPA